jgi:hypothetical protein
MRRRRYCGGVFVVLQKNGKVASQPIHDLVTANGAGHDWGGSWGSGAGAIAIHGRRFLRNKTTTRKIATVAAIKAPVRISSRERPTSTWKKWRSTAAVIPATTTNASKCLILKLIGSMPGTVSLSNLTTSRLRRCADFRSSPAYYFSAAWERAKVAKMAASLLFWPLAQSSAHLWQIDEGKMAGYPCTRENGGVGRPASWALEWSRFWADLRT